MNTHKIIIFSLFMSITGISQQANAFPMESHLKKLVSLFKFAWSIGGWYKNRTSELKEEKNNKKNETKQTISTPSLHIPPFESPATLKQFLKDNNALKGALIPTKNKKHYGVPLYQLKVLRQGRSYCGYHATKNILFTKDFINNPTPENLAKLQDLNYFSTPDQWGYRNASKNLWTQWDRTLRTSNRVENEMKISERFIESESTSWVKGVMEPTFLHDMLTTENERQKIEAYDTWNEYTFSNFFESNLTLENIVRINEQFSQLQQQNGYYGIAFGKEKIGGHWLSLVLAKNENGKYAFCFDSNWNQNKLNFSTVKFFTKAFSSPENNAFLNRYLKTTIPSIIKNLNKYSIKRKNNRDKLRALIISDNQAIEILSEGLKENAYLPLREEINTLLTENRNELGQQLLQAVQHVQNIFNDPIWEEEKRKEFAQKFFKELKTSGELSEIINGDYIHIIDGKRPASYVPNRRNPYIFPGADTFADTLKYFLDTKIAHSMPFNIFLQIHPLIHKAINHIFGCDNIQNLPQQTKINIQNKLREIVQKLDVEEQQKASELIEELKNYFITILDETPTPPTVSLFQSNLTSFFNDKIQADVPNDTLEAIRVKINEITNLLPSSEEIRINELDESITSKLTTTLENIEQILNNLQNFKAHTLKKELRARFINIFNINQSPPSLSEYFFQISTFFKKIQNGVSSNTYNKIFDEILDVKDLLNPHSTTSKPRKETKMHELPINIKNDIKKELKEIDDILKNARESSTETKRKTDERISQKLKTYTTFNNLEQLEQTLSHRFGIQQDPEESLEFESKLASTNLIGEKLTINQNAGHSRSPQHAGKKKIENAWVYDVQVLTQCPGRSGYNLGEEKFRNLFGCAFHSLKNVLFMTKMVLDAQFIEPGQADLNSAKTFLHYFEASSPLVESDWKHKWAHDFGDTSWYFLWKQYRQSKSIPHCRLDNPPTQDYDLENLKQKIINKKALAPEWAADITKNTTIIEYIDGEILTKTTRQDVLKLLKLAKEFEENESIVLPFLIAYTHEFDQYQQRTNPRVYGTTGRHWITVVINKFKGNIEALFADSWRFDTYMPKNFSSTKTLLKWLTKPQETVKQYVVAVGDTKKARYETITDEQLEEFKREVNKIYSDTF